MYDALIKSYLARAPQDGEFQTLASAGSLSQAEQMIKGSDEYFIRETLYHQLADRLPEADGYGFWTNKLLQGNRVSVKSDFVSAVQTISSPDASKFTLINEGPSWWGGALSFLAPILNANSGVRLSDTVFIQDVYQNCGGTLGEASGGAHRLMIESSEAREALASDVIYSMLTGDLTHQPANLNSDEHATAVQRQVTFAK